MNYRVLSVAAVDLAEAMEFYEKQSSGLGLEFLNEFEAVIQRILSCPHAWTSISSNQRRTIFRRFPYAVLYSNNNIEILITAVMDLRIEPVRKNARIQRTE